MYLSYTMLHVSILHMSFHVSFHVCDHVYIHIPFIHIPLIVLISDSTKNMPLKSVASQSEHQTVRWDWLGKRERESAWFIGMYSDMYGDMYSMVYSMVYSMAWCIVTVRRISYFLNSDGQRLGQRLSGCIRLSMYTLVYLVIPYIGDLPQVIQVYCKVLTFR